MMDERRRLIAEIHEATREFLLVPLSTWYCDECGGFCVVSLPVSKEPEFCRRDRRRKVKWRKWEGD